MKMSGSVVIVTFNSADTIAECLNSLMQSKSDRTFLTIVVDNCSEDDTVALIKQNYEWVRLIESPDNGGFGAANNQGIAAAEGEWIFFLNPDATIDQRALSVLAQQLSRDESIGIIAPSVIDSNGVKTVSYFPFLNLWTSIWIAIGLQKFIPLSKSNNKWSIARQPVGKTVEVDRVIGAAMLVRRTALQEIGDFDTRYFLFSEEEDLCFRFSRAGWKVMYCPEAESRHIGGVTLRKSEVISMAAANWSRYLFLKKFRGELVAEMSRWIWISALLVRLMGAFVVGNSRSKSLVIKGYFESIRSLLMPGYFDKYLRPKRKKNTISAPSA